VSLLGASSTVSMDPLYDYRFPCEALTDQHAALLPNIHICAALMFLFTIHSKGHLGTVQTAKQLRSTAATTVMRLHLIAAPLTQALISIAPLFDSHLRRSTHDPFVIAAMKSPILYRGIVSNNGQGRSHRGFVGFMTSSH
jgi:archaellum biogenesis protein FlaJ (TadC family)